MVIPKPAKRAPKPRKPIKRGKRPARVRRRGSRGELRELADDLMSLFIRHEAGWTCWVCGSGRYEEMQMAHLYPKGAHPAGRYMAVNVRCLCKRCHRYYTDRDAEWTRLLRGKLGDEEYERLGQIVDVRSGPHDYMSEIVYWHIALRDRNDAWKIEERIQELEAKMERLGI